jgi:predicted esterase
MRIEELEVPGYLPALVAAPNAGEKRPLVVATHGAGGTPDAYCNALPALLDGSAFVLCPRGKRVSRFEPEGGGFYYPDHRALLAEVEAALAAFRGKYGDRADLERPVYFGFSQGAAMGALVLPRLPFRAAILVEGGYDVFTVALARGFHAAGGERVLFGCGQATCAAKARTSIGYVERGGVAARLAYAQGAGHSFGGAVMAEVAAALPWLLEGDARFRVHR